MAFKYIAAFALVTLAVVSAAPYYSGGHDDDDGHGYGAGDGGSGTSHQSVHLVSHDDGHDDGGHGHGDHGHYGGHDDGHDTHAEYDFNYGVSDSKTGDHKGHSETRKGHKVSGHYELIDADGHKRTVVYTADKHKGFQATVHREATHIKVPAPAAKGSGHHGGHAQLEQHSSSDGDHGFGGHDDGHYGHGHGHGGGSSTAGFSLKQDHGSQGHGYAGHGGDDHYSHGYH